MVRVLANGDIVPDDDPRVSQQTSRPQFSNESTSPNQRNTRLVHNARTDDNPVHHAPQTGSIFTAFNNQLTHYGVPTWHLGPYTVEPIASAGFLISLLVFGFQGLLFSGLLFFIVKYSQQGLGGGRRFETPGWVNRLGFGGADVGGEGNRRGQDQGRPSRGFQGQARAGEGGGARTGSWTGAGHRLGDS